MLVPLVILLISIILGCSVKKQKTLVITKRPQTCLKKAVPETVKFGVYNYGEENRSTMSGDKISGKVPDFPCSWGQEFPLQPVGQPYTYNNDLTNIYKGAPPDYQANCYQYPCPEGFKGNDICFRCGEKPYTGSKCPPKVCQKFPISVDVLRTHENLRFSESKNFPEQVSNMGVPPVCQ